MLKFIFCRKSIWLFFIIILYCAASPTEDGTKGGKPTEVTKATKAKKATKSGETKKGTTTGKSGAKKGIQDDNQLTVNTTCGLVIGIWKNTFSTNPKNQAKYRSFKAIPYAEAPIGKLRFKAPKKKKPWPKPIVTTDNYGACCLEMPLDPSSKKVRDENCLFLNIFTPADIPMDAKLPVLFFIHGGGSCQGCGDDKFYGPDPFMEKGRGVILVTINYRLGVFGFLAIDEEISGNAAYKDQYMALRWIYDNINSFGGDPKRITLFGQSAGARAVAHQILYPKSREIIERAIIMSGRIILQKYVERSLQEHVFYREFPDAFKTDADRTVSKLREFLITVNAAELQKKLPLSEDYPGIGNTQYWSTIIEDEYAINPFITENPLDTYKKGNIDVETMFGFTSMEFSNVISKEQFDIFVDNIRVQKTHMPLVIYKLHPAYAKEYNDILTKADQEILKLYWIDKPIDKSRESFIIFNKMLSDTRAIYQMDKSAKVHAANTKLNTFLYEFKVNLLLNYVKDAENSTDMPGATHSEDIPYLFLCNGIKNLYEKASKSTDPKSVQTMAAREFFLEFFLEFAKTGFKNGTGKYKPIKANKANAIEISSTGIKPIVAPNKKIIQLIEKVTQDVSEWIFG